MVGLCDLYLWNGLNPSIVYLIDTVLSYKEAEEIAKSWGSRGGDYDLMNKGHIPAWHDYAKPKPTIKRISKSMINRI